MMKQHGFTLIELMVTISIAAILLTVGAPSFSTMMQNNRIATHTNTFISSMHLARSEAVKRSMRVTMCPTTNGTSCANSNDWTTGWLVFTDNSGTIGTFDPADVLLRAQEAFKDDTTLTSNVAADTTIGFLASGFLSKGAALNLTLARPGCTGMRQQRNIRVNATGQIRMAVATCP